MMKSMAEWISFLMYCAFKRKWVQFCGVVFERPEPATEKIFVSDANAEQIVSTFCRFGTADRLGYLL